MTPVPCVLCGHRLYHYPTCRLLVVDECRCSKYEGCDPCRHDAIRYREALEAIGDNSIARAALDGEG